MSENLKASLQWAQVAINTKASAVAEFEAAEAKAEEELAAIRTAMEQRQFEQSDDSAQFEAVGTEVSI